MSNFYNENEVRIAGNLGADPELRYTGEGKAVCNISVATNKSWLDKTGQRQERTEWHRVVVWGKAAVAVARYKRTGDSVKVIGELRTRTYESANGEKHYVTEIHTVKVQFGPVALRNLVPREEVADFYKEMATYQH